jgi:hypothetical protein
MILRRRKTRIEIEQTTLHVEDAIFASAGNTQASIVVTRDGFDSISLSSGAPIDLKTAHSSTIAKENHS